MAGGHRHPDAPSRFLVENIDLLPPGTALDIAMGAGRNAVYLAQHGFQVTGVDNDPEALQQAEEKARTLGVSLNAVRGDLENGYVVPLESYDAVICFNYLYRPFFPSIKASLKPGGIIVYETYTVDQTKFGPPRNPDHLLRYNELLEVFREYRCLRYHEGIYEDSKAIAGIIAVKPVTGGNTGP
jgi:SAM-dependent methyltransferase